LGNPVTLQNATATFSQTLAANFSVATAIDGSKTNALGWAIQGAIVNQTAAFETSTDTPAFAGGTQIGVVLTHDFAAPSDHSLGSFRVAVTTSDRSSFADGNSGATTPGNVGPTANWTVLEPISACATNDTITFESLVNDAILVSEHDVTPVVYTIVFQTPLTGITGVRLEALEHPSLPSSGPGTNDGNGNFVLTELEVHAKGL
jgi:hypothetical protein